MLEISMNRQAVAKELVAVAKLLSAGSVGRIRKTWWFFAHKGAEVWWDGTVKLVEPDDWMQNEDAEYKDEKEELLREIGSDVRRVKAELGRLCGGKITEGEWFESESIDGPAVGLTYRLEIDIKDIPDVPAMKKAIDRLGFTGPMQ
jgi:hypothetical protein